MAEGVQRGRLEVDVGPPPAPLDPVGLGFLEVVVDGQLAGVAGHGHGELAAGVDVAEEDLGHGLAPCSPGSQASTTAGTWAASQRVASGRPLIRTTAVGVPVECTASRALPAGRSARGSPRRTPRHRSACLPSARRSFSPRTTTATSACRGLLRPGDLVDPVARDRPALDVRHLRIGRHRRFDAFQYRDDVLGDDVRDVVTELVPRLVGVGPDHRDRLERLPERQHAPSFLSRTIPSRAASRARS